MRLRTYLDAEPPPPGPSIPRRRTKGIHGFALVNLLLTILSVCLLRVVSGADHYARTEAADIGTELEAALAGLWVLRIGLIVLAAGFTISALGAVSLTRIGWRAQLLWAILVSLSVVGLLYGIPALLFLLRSDTRARFGVGPKSLASGSTDWP